MLDQIDLLKFCDSIPRPHALWTSKPFVRGGYRYATNSKMAVRVPSVDADSDIDARPQTLGLLVGYFDDFPAIVDTLWPEVETATDLVQCNECGGHGNHSIDCEECDGDGYEVCHSCGHEDDCEACNGEGEVAGDDCEACSGKGQVEKLKWQRFEDGRISIENDLLVRELPNVRYVIVGHRILFTFDGGEGVTLLDSGKWGDA